MGSGRGGAYTYDWIENLFGLGMRSADTVHPEWQSLAVGDVIPGRASLPGMRVDVLEAERTPRDALGGRDVGLGVRARRPRGQYAAVEPEPDRDARPVARRPHRGGGHGARLAVMERKMLLGHQGARGADSRPELAVSA